MYDFSTKARLIKNNLHNTVNVPDYETITICFPFTVSDQLDSGMFVWTTVLSAVSAFILLLLVLMLLHNDRWVR